MGCDGIDHDRRSGHCATGQLVPVEETRPYLFAGRAHGVAIRIPIWDPLLPAECHYRYSFDVGTDDVGLADVVSEAVMLTVVGDDDLAFLDDDGRFHLNFGNPMGRSHAPQYAASEALCQPSLVIAEKPPPSGLLMV